MRSVFVVSCFSSLQLSREVPFVPEENGVAVSRSALGRIYSDLIGVRASEVTFVLPVLDHGTLFARLA
jgi:hypothetical protein